MPKSENQKLKLLYLVQYLMEKTDENHMVSTADIIAHLAANGISAERKSIYTDIELLIDFGLDIEKVKGRPSGYKLLSRQFELAELKLLVDAVQASKFITGKKSRELIGKLETLCSKNDARQLHRQVVVTNRTKAVNENIYYNVDQIYTAIAENVQIQFYYFDWNVKKEMELRHDGALYQVSPWLLTWDDDNYYLIAYDDNSGIIKHYRVDKMLKINISTDKRNGKEQFEHFDLAAYSNKTFGMFAGDEKMVTLSFKPQLTGVIIDRFGSEIALREGEDGKNLARVKVAVSRPFFGWLTGLGRAVTIASPSEVVEEYQAYLKEILENYS